MRHVVAGGERYTWRRFNGLFVPDNLASADTHLAGRSGNQRVDTGPVPGGAASEPAMLRATRQQALGTVLGALVSLVALIVGALALGISYSAWHGQLELNRQQGDLNRIALADRREIYSSRVAMWAALASTRSSVYPDGVDVWIQNRAPIPIHDVTVLATLSDGVDAGVVIGDLVPCTQTTLRLAAPAGSDLRAGGRQWLGYTLLRLEFTETNRGWLVAGGSLSPIMPAQVTASPPRRLLAADVQSTHLDGC